MLHFLIHYRLKYALLQRREKLYFWIAWRLPKWLVYFATIRLAAHATTGEYGMTIPSELDVMEAIKRWGYE